MPFNQDFRLDVLVGDCVIPEYEKDGEYFVESCLHTPLSYSQKVEQFVNGEYETQTVPVTPYTLKLTANPSALDRYYYKVYVDGVKVKGISLPPGSQKIIRGFKDGPFIREFLFTLPRFANSEGDRVETERSHNIGRIEVECWLAELRFSAQRRRDKALGFLQANKKDCTTVTNGQYTMATSKAGKIVTNRSTIHKVDSYQRVSLKSKLIVQYHMVHTLQEMGFDIKPIAPACTNNQRQSQQHRSSGRNSKKTIDEVKDLAVKSESDSVETKDESDDVITIKTEPNDVEYVGSSRAVTAGPSGCSSTVQVIDLTDDDDNMR